MYLLFRRSAALLYFSPPTWLHTIWTPHDLFFSYILNTAKASCTIHLFCCITNVHAFTKFTWILLKKTLSQILSLRMTPLLTSAPFLFAAKLSSQRFNGLLAWLKICRGGKEENGFWLGTVPSPTNPCTFVYFKWCKRSTSRSWHVMHFRKLDENTTACLRSPCRTYGWAIEAPRGKWSVAGPSCHLGGGGCHPDRTQCVLHDSTPPTADTHTHTLLQNTILSDFTFGLFCLFHCKNLELHMFAHNVLQFWMHKKC